jgi:transaldolase
VANASRLRSVAKPIL